MRRRGFCNGWHNVEERSGTARAVDAREARGVFEPAGVFAANANGDVWISEKQVRMGRGEWQGVRTGGWCEGMGQEDGRA
jgi:hypothetical protein